MENLELWKKVEKTTTDTKTKEVSYGSRKFTAIDAYSQIKTATEQFGKYGEKWGFSDVSYEVIDGRIYFIGTFYYPNGKFPIFNDQKVGDDAAKKVFTDSLTKALSYLGFNSDIFMGKFDGNKYTQESFKKEGPDTGEKPKWLNAPELTEIAKAIVESGEVPNKEQQATINGVIQEDGYTVSNNAKNALLHYYNTGEIVKDLFFPKKK